MNTSDTRSAPEEWPPQQRLLDLLKPIVATLKALTEEEARVVEAELAAAAHVSPSASILSQCQEVAARVPERLHTDSAAVLLRMHEIAGSGNLESCRSSHATVRAIYQLGWQLGMNEPRAEREYAWELIVGRGHIAPAFYAEEYVRGRLPFALLATLHRGGLNGVIHKDWGFPNTMGYSLGIGIAQATSRSFWLTRQGNTDKVVCLAGDGELHEGLTFECLRFVDERELSNLVLVVDANGKGIEPLQRELRAADLAPFFPEVVEVDGTDEAAVAGALREALRSPQRRAIICRTKKGNHSFKLPGAPASAPRFSQRSGALMKQFLTEKELDAVTITADMVDRFGLRGHVPYVNVSLAETLSVGLTLGLPPAVMKFIATDAKYYFDSIGTLIDVTSTVERVVLLAGKSWGVWGGEPTALNTLAVQKNVKVYEPITEREFVACLRRADANPKDVHVLSLMDAEIADNTADCASDIDGGVWLKEPRSREGIVVTFGYAGALVREAIRGLPLGHLHCASLRPHLRKHMLQMLANCPGVLAVEYNGLAGGFGEYLRSNHLIGCESHAVTKDLVNAPLLAQLQHHEMDVNSIALHLATFAGQLMSPFSVTVLRHAGGFEQKDRLATM